MTLMEYLMDENMNGNLTLNPNQERDKAEIENFLSLLTEIPHED